MTISLFLYAKIVSLYRFTSPWCTKLPMSLLGSICSSPMICWWKFIHSSAKPRNRTEAPKTEAVGFWFCWAPFGFWILRTEVYENWANQTDWTDYTECPALCACKFRPAHGCEAASAMKSRLVARVVNNLGGGRGCRFKRLHAIASQNHGRAVARRARQHARVAAEAGARPINLIGC